jgi:hypothetical protein|tara:strand:- start:3281 stop:3457 length:177 start_codon:yes stop_codon:yes gene_type:complete
MSKLVCDRCDKEMLEDDPAMCFNDTVENSKLYLCEPCIEAIKQEFIYENRDTNFIESN